MIGNLVLSLCILLNIRCYDININQVKNKISDNYYKTIPDSIKRLEWNEFQKYLDPYTRILDSNGIYEFDKDMQNVAKGVIGISIDSVKEGYKVIEIENEGSAYENGIMRGDIIRKVNNKKPKSLKEFSSMVRGDVGTSVKIEVLREQKILHFTVERSVIYYRNVHSQILNNTAIIDIESFHNLAGIEFTLHSVALNTHQIDTLIIDLRDNPGGLLNECLRICDDFFDSHLVLLSRVSSNTINHTYSTKGGEWLNDIIIIVLQNQYSASASELLSASLKEGRGAIIIGETSYGKGLVQSQVDIDGGRLLVTSSEYFPLGHVKVDGVGVSPHKKLHDIKKGYLPKNFDIKKFRKLYPKPSIDALNDPQLKGKRGVSHLIWEKDGELFEILLQKPFN